MTSTSLLLALEISTRAVFCDYEDIILDQKRALELMTNVPDEVRRALNLLDDYVHPAPPGSTPYSPSSPAYSPVQYSPIMKYPDWASETTCNTANTSGDEGNDMPLVE